MEWGGDPVREPLVWVCDCQWADGPGLSKKEPSNCVVKKLAQLPCLLCWAKRPWLYWHDHLSLNAPKARFYNVSREINIELWISICLPVEQTPVMSKANKKASQYSPKTVKPQNISCRYRYTGIFLAFVVSKNLKIGIPRAYYNHIDLNSNFTFDQRSIRDVVLFQI